jgi:Transcription factor WhiB
MAELVGAGGAFGDEWSEVGHMFDLIAERPAWHAGASCRKTPPSGSLTWFPEHPREGRKAIAICERCPAVGPCAAWSVAQGPLLKGIWGAMSERQRNKLRGSAA